MEIWNYDKQAYGELNVLQQILLKAINISGRVWHGKEEWERMNSRYLSRRRATEINRLGNVLIYENHRN